jgi:4-hydroxy 2-oxovalerate aldolase
MGQQIRITDVTLRDGSHAVRHQFSKDQIVRVVGALDAAGMPVIEVCHGDGLAGASVNYGFSAVHELELLETAAATVKQATLAVLLIPGIGTIHDLKEAHKRGAGLVRVATHSTEADISAQHIAAARELGMEAVGFLMMSHMVEPAELARQAKLMESYGAQVVYVVDSAGAQTMPMVQARVAALRAALNPETKIGFHGHNNLGLAVGNSIVAIDAGAAYIDTACRGLGAGAGNTATEAMVAVCAKSDIATGVNLRGVMDIAEDIVAGEIGVTPLVDRASITIGYAGVYSSFLLHARRAAERFGVSETEILEELGRRRVVGGQEDMIVDVAIELAKRGGSVPAPVPAHAG